MQTFKTFLEANQPLLQQPNLNATQPNAGQAQQQQLRTTRLQAYRQLSAAVRVLRDDPEWSQNQEYLKSFGPVSSFVVNLGGSLRRLYGEQSMPKTQ